MFKNLRAWTPLALLSVVACGDTHGGPKGARAQTQALSGLSASFDWSVPDRLRLDDTNSFVPVPVNPDRWPVDFDACASGPSGGIAAYRWTFDGARVPVTTQECKVSHDFPSEGVYSVSLTVVAADGTTATSAKEVTIQDFLIVALGDSYGAGEGSPNREIEPNLFTKWVELQATLVTREAERTHAADVLRAVGRVLTPVERLLDAITVRDALSCSVCRPSSAKELLCFAGCPTCFPAVCLACKDGCQSAADNVTTAAGELAAAVAEAAQTEGLGYLQDLLSDPTGLKGELESLRMTWEDAKQLADDAWQAAKGELDLLPDRAKVVWQDKQCHRSTFAAQARAAIAIEAADSKSSVTFVHLACSGAKSTDLYTNGYPGVEPDAGDPLRAQLAVARDLVQGREVDALLLSIGGNDANFAPIIFAGIAQEPTHNPDSPLFTKTDEVALGTLRGLCTSMFFLTGKCLSYAEAVSQIGLGAPGKQLFQEGIAGLGLAYQVLDGEIKQVFPAVEADSRRIYITQYPNATQDELGGTCGPRLDKLPNVLDLPGWSTPEWTWAAETVIPSINQGVQATGHPGRPWTVVPGIFEDFAAHGYCSENNWINRLQQSLTQQGDPSGTVHPNRAGYQKIADHILATIKPDLYPTGGRARPPRVSPVADSGGPRSVNEGSFIELTNASVDPGRAGSLTFHWSLQLTPAGAGTLDSASAPVPHLTAFDDAVGTVSVQVDSALGRGTSESLLVIRNVAPAVSAPLELEAVEGTIVAVDATFVDPGLRDAHTARITWGDGETTDTTLALGVREVRASHVYTIEGVYQAQVLVRDDDGGEGTANMSVTVRNMPATIEPIAAPTDPVLIGTPVAVSAQFVDPGRFDTHIATWDWGDGTTSEGMVGEASGSGVVQGTHTYDRVGAFGIKLFLTDSQAAVTEAVFHDVVVVDRSVCQAATRARGLRGEYFDNKDLTNPKITRTDGPISFDWGLRSPERHLAVDTFSARWSGFVVPRTTGVYKFFTTSDDGVRLWVNEVALVNNWTDHTSAENSGSIALQADIPVPVRLEAYDNTGSALIKLEWMTTSNGGQPRELIPRARLYPPGAGTCTSSGTLLAHWKLDEPGGITAADDTCAGNHATLRDFPAPPAWTTGHDQGGLAFDGVRTWLRAPASDSLNRPATTAQLTAAAWVKRTQVQTGYRMITMRQADADPTKEVWALGFNNNKLAWLINSQGGGTFQCTAASDAPLNQWLRIAGTFDGQTARAYIDGLEVCNFKPTTRALALGGTPVIIGAGANADDVATEFFNGTIDEVALYDRALSPAELASTRQTGACALESGRPVLNLPTEILAVETGGTGGAPVTYAASAADDPSGFPLATTCTPASGATFSLGTTLVTCSARGPRGISLGTFKVRVTPQRRGNHVALLVVGNSALNNGDSFIKARLTAAGYDVVVKTGTGVATADANNKALIVVTESAGNGEVGTKFNATRVPVLVMNLGLLRDMTMTGDTFQDDKGQALDQTDLQILAPEHPMAAGLRGQVTVASAPTSLFWGRPAASAVKIAALAGSADQVAVFGYETGALLTPVSGQTTLEAPARRVGFFAGTNASLLLTAEGAKLLDAAMVWATQAEALLVVENGPIVLRPGDLALRSRLTDLGYGVVVKDAKQVLGTHADSASVVVVSDSITESQVGTRLTNTATPIVASRLFGPLGMTGVTASDAGGTSGGVIGIVDASLPLAGGFGVGSLSVAVPPGTLKWGRPSASASLVGVLPGQPAAYTLFGYSKGSLMVGLTAPGRRVGWFGQADLPPVLTAEGWKLFDAAVRWAAGAEPSLAGTYALKAISSGKCVDVLGASQASGAALVQADCNVGDSQLWIVRDLGGDAYELDSLNSNRCADVAGAATTNGAALVQSACTGGNSQRWKLIGAAAGQYQLQAMHSGRCMEVMDGSQASGAALDQALCNDGNNQRFELRAGPRCASESDLNACWRAGRNCGAISLRDNCGLDRSVATCGMCASTSTCGGDGVANVCSSLCALRVTQNVYSGAQRRGTITIRNDGSASSANHKVELDLPAGFHCTNDVLPTGATLSPLTGTGSSARTISSHCVFTWSNTTPLASGASKTFTYAADAIGITAATSPLASDPACR
jgi:PKD repeat protein